MSTSLVDRARESRKSPSTLKTSLSNLRTRYPDDPIIIFEGVDDIGPYETWINSIIEGYFFNMLPGNGKEQVLLLRDMLQSDMTGLKLGVFFIVDKDFDELQGRESGQDIFCPERYSVENYLISETVVQSILRDEFRLMPYTKEFEQAIELYRQSINSLANQLQNINFHLFCCRKNKIQLQKATPDLKKFAVVKLNQVHLSAEPERLIEEHFAPQERLPEPRDNSLSEEFSALNPMKHHRGKFFYDFLRRWFECLAEEANNPTGLLGGKKLSNKFSSASITMRSCASRSERPEGLKDFIFNVYSKSEK